MRDLTLVSGCDAGRQSAFQGMFDDCEIRPAPLLLTRLFGDLAGEYARARAEAAAMIGDPDAAAWDAAAKQLSAAGPKRDQAEHGQAA